jgi:hypothetical protein
MRPVIVGAAIGIGIGIIPGLVLGALIAHQARAAEAFITMNTALFVVGICTIVGAIAGLGETVRGATAVLLDTIEKQRPQAGA